MVKANVLECQRNRGILTEGLEVTLEYCIPRPFPVILDDKGDPLEPWSVAKSLFKNFTPDSQVGFA